MNVILVSASNSKTSINEEILRIVQAQEGFDVLDLLDYKDIPILSKSLFDSEGIPDSIKVIYEIFLNYEKIVFFAPEHNFYLTAFFKNILDWLSLLKKEFLESKRVLLVSVSNTAKERRNMEDAVRKTFELFGPEEFVFFNFNNFSDVSFRKLMLEKLIRIINL